MVLLRAGPESLGPAILKRLQRRDTLETIALEGGGLACNYQEECGAKRPYSPSRREKEGGGGRRRRKRSRRASPG